MNTLKIKTIQFQPLSLFSDIVCLQFDNSSTIIDEMEGEDFFNLLLDTKANSVIVFPNNKGESISKQFLDAENAGLYYTYIEWKSFEGCFNVNAYGIDTIKRIGFHGSEITDSENVSDTDLKLISSILTPKNVFALLNEVLNLIK